MNVTPDRTIARQIDIDKALEVRITWEDGHVSEFPVQYLRRHCPCATCRSHRREGPKQGADQRKGVLRVLRRRENEPVSIQEAKLVGGYAIQLFWSDRHTTGIYSFEYLRSLDDASAADSAGAGR